MSTPSRRNHIAHICVAAILAVATLPAALPGAASAAAELLPDLQMAAPYSIQIQVRTNGTKLLRFGTIAWNVGEGPLEVRARDRVGTRMTTVAQRVKTADGGFVGYVVPGMTAFYSGDGHNHWHIERFIDVSLGPPPGATVTTEPRRLRKIGFCLVDILRAPASLRPPNSRLKRGFWVDGCGTKTSTKLRVGISVGWGDDYRPFFTYQHINVTTLPAGNYRLCATVNPAGVWREGGAIATNNSYWYDLDINPAAATVTPVAHALGSCTDPPVAP